MADSGENIVSDQPARWKCWQSGWHVPVPAQNETYEIRDWNAFDLIDSDCGSYVFIFQMESGSLWMI